MIGEEIEKSDLELLSDHFEWIDDDKIFIPSFVEFQYKVSTPKELNENNNAHKGVISQLKKYNLLAPNEGLVSPKSGASQTGENAATPVTTGLNGHDDEKRLEKVLLVKNEAGSCRSHSTAT